MPLDRLWTRTVARIWYPGEEGEEKSDQLEGTIQYIRPDRVLVTFSKVNNLYAILGSNAQKYWWIELGDHKRAHVGEHAKATPERIAELGLPIHPLDFVDLIGITPLPVMSPGASAGGTPTVQWSQDGRSVVITMQGRYARRRLVLDPVTYEPSRIEFLDSAGAPAVYSDLGKYEPVAIAGGTGPRIPTEIFASLDRDRTRARLRLTSPEVGEQRPKPGVFDLERLLSTNNVREVISLDEPTPPAAAGTAGTPGL
jgi:hypothetical protein